MPDISEAMVEALQAAHNLIANTAFDAGESHQWAVAVDEKIQAALALSAAPASAQMEGLSTWSGWDKARPPWGECKHKDAVLEALFRAPWSAEDAAMLIGFIDRTWPVALREALPAPEGKQ